MLTNTKSVWDQDFQKKNWVYFFLNSTKYGNGKITRKWLNSILVTLFWWIFAKVDSKILYSRGIRPFCLKVKLSNCLNLIIVKMNIGLTKLAIAIPNTFYFNWTWYSPTIHGVLSHFPRVKSLTENNWNIMFATLSFPYCAKSIPPKFQS